VKKSSFIFIARDSIYAKRAYAIAIPSVCLSVCHTGDSCKNGWHIYTISVSIKLVEKYQ